MSQQRRCTPWERGAGLVQTGQWPQQSGSRQSFSPSQEATGICSEGGAAEIHCSPWLPGSAGRSVPAAMASALSRLCPLRPARGSSQSSLSPFCTSENSGPSGPLSSP